MKSNPWIVLGGMVLLLVLTNTSANGWDQTAPTTEQTTTPTQSVSVTDSTEKEPRLTQKYTPKKSEPEPV